MKEKEEKKNGKTGRMSGVLFVQLPPKLKHEFKVLCAERELTMNDVVTVLIERTVKKMSRKTG